MTTVSFALRKKPSAHAAIALLIFGYQTIQAEIIDLAPARAPDAPQIARMLHHAPQPDGQPAVALRILNMPLDSETTPIVHLDLQPAGAVTEHTRFVVIGDAGERPLTGDFGKRYIGHLTGDAKAAAFVSIAPDGDIRAIIHQDGETIVNEYQPGSQTTVSATTTRSIEMARDFSHHSFQCGTNALDISSFIPRNTFTEPLSLTAPAEKHAGQAGDGLRRRADIIVDTDYEFLQVFNGNKNRAAAYIADVFAYVSQLYEKEINTRLNLTKVILRDTPNDPWNVSMPNTAGMLEELTDYGNRPNHPEYNVPHHHVHLLSGKRDQPDYSGGIAWIDTLDSTQELGYGLTAGIYGNFSPSRPEIIWDTAGLAHELGHAFGSDHTHAFDTSYVGSREDGAIDCCAADYGIPGYGLQCQGREGRLPGINSITGGVSGQRTGTLMSYCNNINGNYNNMAWTFGVNHPYGVKPERVPQLMTGQAQKYLPLDTANSPFPPSACQARSFSPAEERILDVYLAYYGRPADTAGLSWWTDALNAAGGNINSIMQAFAISDEYTRRFGHMNNGDLVENLYWQLFGRPAEPTGLRIYTQELSSGSSTLADISLVILDNTSGGDIAIIKSRKDVARHYVTTVENRRVKDMNERDMPNIFNGVQDTASANAACQRLNSILR